MFKKRLKTVLVDSDIKIGIYNRGNYKEDNKNEVIITHIMFSCREKKIIKIAIRKL